MKKLKRTNKYMQKQTIPAAVLIAAALIMLFAFVLTGCGQTAQNAGGESALEFGPEDTVTEDVFLKNGDGTYTYCEIVAPDTEGPYPLVIISHGIYGSLNSGGARLLSELLASNGIAAVRADFNRCLTDDPDKALAKDKSGRTNDYTLKDML